MGVIFINMSDFCLFFSFFLARLMNKKYPAVRLPDILMSKLYFEKIASVAF